MRRSPLKRSFCAAGLLLVVNGWSLAQTLKPRLPASREAEKGQAEFVPPAAIPVTLPMTVPSGTPIKVALDSEVRIRTVGQPIHGKTTEPVYAFDKLLLPVGTPV